MFQELIVLGSGGGRYVTITQQRRTGGLLLIRDGGYFVVDPGPGSILMLNQLNFNAFAVQGVLISHRHPDHYADAEVYIEAMTRGGREKRGLLAAARSVLETVDIMGFPAISGYHQGLPAQVVAMKPGDETVFNGVRILAFHTVHSDPYSVGFQLSDGGQTLVYVPDTELLDAGVEGIEDVNLLVLSVLRPGADRYQGHLCTHDAVKIVKTLKPRRVLITHFGARMVRAGPEGEAAKIAESTGVPTRAASDGLRIRLP